MNILLSAILPKTSRPKPGSPEEASARLIAEYTTRANRYLSTEQHIHASEDAFLTALDARTTRSPTHLILLDSRGQLLTSEDFASRLGTLRDGGTQRLILAIGPADGWSPAARHRANLLFSFGRITLPHQLARVLLAEQTYRALTILANHPYHSGH